MSKDLSYKIFIVNLITAARIVLIAFSLVNSSVEFLLVISIVAGISDFFDGLLARKWDATSQVGGQLDQISDKIFHIGMFIHLWNLGLVHTYFLLLFVFREILITVLRFFRTSQPASNFLGQLKTFIAYLFIIVLLTWQFALSTATQFFPVIVYLVEGALLLISYLSFLKTIKLGPRNPIQ